MIGFFCRVTAVGAESDTVVFLASVVLYVSCVWAGRDARREATKIGGSRSCVGLFRHRFVERQNHGDYPTCYWPAGRQFEPECGLLAPAASGCLKTRCSSGFRDTYISTAFTAANPPNKFILFVLLVFLGGSGVLERAATRAVRATLDRRNCAGCYVLFVGLVCCRW